MTTSLAELADRAGIESSYIRETGEHCQISDDVKQALLDAMELPRDGPCALPEERGREGTETFPCFVPEWLQQRRAWGISVQLYGVRSARNAGIGDFEDLARLAEMFAAWGADFIGVNPLHALFSADPERASPYSPSSRQYLNPIYIAVDEGVSPSEIEGCQPIAAALRNSEYVDYAGAAALKRLLLERAFEARADDPAFKAFCLAEGEALRRFATFETLSEHFVTMRRGADWQSWPEEMRVPESPAVAEFAQKHEQRIRFHKWLQWLAAVQLAGAQRRARAAGMRIGIYLDLAVGVSPAGAAAWSDQALFATRARIGAPPDMFNQLGQDWGLAPMKPGNLIERHFLPFERELFAAMRPAGAVRLDHAMSLARIFWVPVGVDARRGGYVRYPLDQLLSVLGHASQEQQCIVIGEDLGTLPHGFREIMQKHHVLSYRVFYFERRCDAGFKHPNEYPREALACIATHDLPPLRGWWAGCDIDARSACGIYEAAETEQRAREERGHDRERLVAALKENGILEHTPAASTEQALPEDVFVGTHRYLARAPSWLFALQLEDLAGAVEMVNLPGTDKEHPNWRRKLPVLLEELPKLAMLRKTVEAVAGERPHIP